MRVSGKYSSLAQVLPNVTQALLFLVVVLSLADWCSAEPEELSLTECFRLAITQSESLQRTAQEIRAAEARYQEAVSLLYPTLNLAATQRFRDSLSSSSSVSSNDTPGGGSNNLNVRSKHPLDTALVLRQPIFTGFREYYTAQATKREIAAVGFDKQRQSELLYQDVATIYYQIGFLQEDLTILKRTERALEERVGDLRRFVELGKSRDSEIEAAMSDQADTEAVQARISGLLDSSKELLAFLVGRLADDFSIRDRTNLPTVRGLDELLAAARNRADIKASSARVESAATELLASERERWPTISFEGNLYPYQDPDTERQWDALFRFQLPIFDGGGIDARVEQSRAKEKSLQLAEQQVRRLAERDVRVAHSAALSSLTELQRLQKLLETRRKNYTSQRRDYELGVVTNLEVLDAIRNVQEAERRLLEAKTRLRTNVVELQVAAGDLLL